jgi:hypothetical protein
MIWGNIGTLASVRACMTRTLASIWNPIFVTSALGNPDPEM